MAATSADRRPAVARHSLFARAPVLSYVVLAYAFTWLISLPLLAARRGWIDTHPGEAWEAIAAFGPFAAALIVAGATGGRDARLALLRDVMRWRVAPRWLVFSVGSPVALLGAAVLVVRVASGAWPDFSTLDSGRLADLAGIAGLVLVAGLAQGLGEEPGWRGFMLPRLRQRHAQLTATLVLFPAWLFWHLPAFLGRPEFGLAQWFAFSTGVLSAAVWLTLVRERTASTLMAIVWHAMINITRGIALAVSMPLFLAMSALVLVGAIVIAAGWLWEGRRARGQSGTGLPVP